MYILGVKEREQIFGGIGALCYDLLGPSWGAHVWALGRPDPSDRGVANASEQSSLWPNVWDSSGHGGAPTASFCGGPSNPDCIHFGAGSFQVQLCSRASPQLQVRDSAHSRPPPLPPRA